VHIQENVELKDYTSLHAGGKAERLIELEFGDHLSEVIVAQKDGPIWVLGFGTNCLISDKGLPGTVILNRTGEIQQISPTRLRADSGVNWDDFVQRLITDNLWGLEFTSCIPGGVGAAVAGNIAAYGHKIADSFVEATMLDSKTGELEVWGKDKFKFDYRSSSLQRSENSSMIILDATFELSPRPNSELEYESALRVAKELNLKPDSLANRREIIIETRRRADALLTQTAEGAWTAGSFFRNPVVDEEQVEAIIAHEEEPGKTKEQILKQNQIHGQNKARVSASHVLLAAGFRRGQTWGKVRLDPEHILKVENMRGASAQEIYDVVQEIVGTVKENLGITLEPEVRFLGEF
jgi:UDP-N-acetylmuramate dehydrogenase